MGCEERILNCFPSMKKLVLAAAAVAVVVDVVDVVVECHACCCWPE